MRLTVNTATFQNLVSKSVRGLGNNKLLPITSFMEIKYSDGQLSLRTTDSTNYLEVISREPVEVDSEPFYVVVEADKFSKLVDRITSDKISMDNKRSILHIKANGNYDLPLPLNEVGEPVVFPKFDVTEGEEFTIVAYPIQVCLNSLQNALSTTTDAPCYMNYYVGEDCVVATDTEKINALLNHQILKKPALISNNMMRLLGIINDGTISVTMDEHKIKFSSEDCIVCGFLPDGVEDFQIDIIRSLIDKNFVSCAEVPRVELQNVLERIALFTNKYSDNGIRIAFGFDPLSGDYKMRVSSLTEVGEEDISLGDMHNFKEFSGEINVFNLYEQVKSLTSDNVGIWYGEKESIKIVDGNVVHVIALFAE